MALSEAEAILGSYPLPGGCRVEPLPGGHINASFRVSPPESGPRFLLQRLNPHVFPDGAAVLRNVARVSAHLARVAVGGPGRQVLHLVHSRGGAPGVRAPDGAWWRLLQFIEDARTLERAETPREAYEVGRGFGRFHFLLRGLPDPPLELTLPGFHDTAARLARLQAAILRNPVGRAAEVEAELEFVRARGAYADLLTAPLASGRIAARIAHNDAKASNVLLDAASGEALAVIDLDTVMPGTPLFDIGDLIRSVTCSTDEDHPVPEDVHVRPDLFEALAAGFLGYAEGLPGEQGALEPAERGLFVTAGMVLTYEQGVRFLTDHLEGDRYYKTARPAQNLDRARVQFALLRSLEQERARLERMSA